MTHHAPLHDSGRPLARLSIDGEMTIYRAAELKDILADALKAAGDGLEIDLSAVSDMDSAGVQLLLLARRMARDKGAEVRLVAHSPAVLDVLALLGLSTIFGASPTVAAVSA